MIVNKVWSTEVFEWSDIASAYRARGETVHIGRVFAIVVLKGSELAVPQQLVKARLVFSGNNVSTNYRRILTFIEFLTFHIITKIIN